jgi:hypothetical protein
MNAQPFYSQFNPATEKIQKAQAFAVKAHAEQKYGSHPYSKHLEAVVSCLDRFGFKPDRAKSNPLIEDIICAGWLHDVKEDTKISVAEIESQFGFNIGDIVSRVTDEQAPSRAERKALTYPKIHGHFGATVVKLADRIANVKACFADNESQFLKYACEQKKFEDAVYVVMMAEPMWSYLRFLLSQKFGEKPQPVKSARFFYEERTDIKIEITAAIKDENLRIEDYAIGESLKRMFDGDLDYERIIMVESNSKDSVLLALLQQRFQGNSAFSEIKDWLLENNIPHQNWSG